MLVEMKREEFTGQDDASLIWACIEPTIRQIRGKSLAVKAEASARLNDAQQALLMFQVLYGHTSSGADEFFAGQSYMLAKEGVWKQFKGSAEFFRDEPLLRLLCEMEVYYFRGNNAPVSPDNEDRPAGIVRLDAALSEVLPVSVRRVGAYILENPGMFVQFSD